jgi:hypothetical protein
MHAVLLALTFLVVITVDPRLEAPLRLFAEVRNGDGEVVGAPYVERARDSRLKLVVWELAPGQAALHNASTREITVTPRTLNEDPRIVATILVHELRHSIDLEDMEQGDWHPDCLDVEARAFEDQAIVARAFWPDELPSGTAIERNLASWVRTYEAGNVTAIRARLAEVPFYREACAEWPA